MQVQAHIRVFRPGEPYHRLLLRFIEIHWERILATGTLAPTELERCVDQLGTHLDHPDTFTLYATFFQAWGRRPAPPRNSTNGALAR